VSYVDPQGDEDTATVHDVIPLSQTAPGAYEAGFNTREIGTYVITVEERNGAEVAGVQTTTLVIPYSQEFTTMQPNQTLIHAIAENAQGRVAPDAGEIYGSMRFGSRTLRDLWPTLIVFLALLLVMDIAVRRVLMPWDEIFAFVGAQAAKYLPDFRLRVKQPKQRSEQVGHLLSVKEKTRASQPDDAVSTTSRLRNLRGNTESGPSAPHGPPSPR